MKLFNQDQILDEAYRKKVIDEISNSENVYRRKEHLKRYEVYRDRTGKYVLERLQNLGLKQETIALMSGHLANISIAKKIINKLARAYSGGVARSSDNEILEQQVAELERLMDFDQKQKKVDRYLELFKNTLSFIKPVKVQVEDTLKIRLENVPLAPWQYDIIQNGYDREKAACVILSDFVERDVGDNIIYSEVEAATHGRRGGIELTDNRDNTIADSPDDTGQGKERTFQFWTDKYHFTTDGNGQILHQMSPEDLLNPIGILPFVNASDEQDGEFWAQGGGDLVDGAILINTLITDMFSIAYQQGWGQIVITGKNLKDKVKIGPHHALIMDYDPANDEPKPEVTVVSPNPPLESWMKAIEQYVALLLSTNNLSPSTVSMSLDAVQFPSGIAMLVEMSEATGSVEDKQRQFVDIERRQWEIIRRWQNLFYADNLLIEQFQEIGQLSDDEISIKFHDQKPIITEKEKLENIEKRKDLGINEMVDLVLMDNPDLTTEEAEQKLLRIQEEKLKRMQSVISQNFQPNEENETDEENEEEIDG